MSVPIAGHTDKKLYYVPKAEFDRVMTLRCSAFDRTRIFAALARINTLYMITRAGSGHIGSSFSSMDIVCWLYLNELRLNTASDNSHRDIYFSSKGHDVPALYSVLIGLGLLPFDYLHKLRRLDGLPGHPDIGTTMIETNTGSLGMGISKAKGIAYAKRACGTKGSIFVLTGDGELQEGQIWESLISAANDRLDEIVLIVDYNKIQSDTWLEKVSHLGDVEAKFRSFGWLVDRCSGHDYSALSETLSGIKKEKIRPKAIIADTIKGKGVSFMESSAFAPDDFYTYHSGAPGSGAYYAAVDELIESANRMMQNLDGRDILLSSSDHHWQKKNSSQENLVRTYAKILVEQGEKDERLVVLDGDLMVDCGLEPFWRKYPQRFIE